MKPWLLVASAALAGVLLAALIARRSGASGPADSSSVELVDAPPDVDGAPQLEATDGAGTWDIDTLLATVNPATYIPAMVDDDTARANVEAFLRTIRYAEGTAGANGYRTMFGYRMFDSYADHPRQPAQFRDKAGRLLWSSAAGAYQAMAVSPIPTGGTTTVDTWDRVAAKLGLPDFSPASQDAFAVELIREKGALEDVKAGRFAVAVEKVRKVWASLPGAGYDQAERPLDSLQAYYLRAGGALA